MSVNHMRFVIPLLVGAAVSVAVFWCAHEDKFFRRLFARYRTWWNGQLSLSNANPRLRTIPIMQAATMAAIPAFCLVAGQPSGIVAVPLVGIAPPWLLKRYRAARVAALQQSLDVFLVALADSLTTVPNLAEALRTSMEHTEPPMREEVSEVLAEVRLGRSLDDALINMAYRLKLPGMDAAVGAALLGKRTGGDLPAILRRIASTLREMARLEGVVKTKTAEGRSQAWVMGMVPPGLVLMLEQINPDWLAPMWSDPIGWLMLGGAAALEVSAIALIRKIMAVDI